MLKYLKIGCGSILLLVVTMLAGLMFWIYSDSRTTEITDYHPFRSKKARAEYLKRYDEMARQWPVASETKFIETSYGKTFILLSGPADGPPLVLLHGLGANSLMWLPNIEELSRAYRVYAIDNIIDYGRSINTSEINSPDDFIKWLDETFTTLKLGNDIHLMGLSYGGWLTGQYALRFPGRLKKIVLLEPPGILPLSKKFQVRAFLTLLPHRYFTRNFFYWIFEDLAKKDEASHQMVGNWADQQYFNMRHFIRRSIPNPTVFNDEELKEIGVPALFIVGENEKIYPAQKAVDHLNTVAPRIETIIIPKAAHDVWISQANLVNEKILRFLKSGSKY
jgi:pimeloyl-ACP methyl ester carboxylesterase